MCSVGKIARAIGAKVMGDQNVEILHLASIGSSHTGDLVFVEEEKHLPAALDSKAAAVIAGSFAESAKTSKALLISANPRLAFARAAIFLQTQDGHAAPGENPVCGVDSTAVVLPTAVVAKSATIGSCTFLGEGVNVGERTLVGSGCMIGRGVSIGEDCRIFPNVTIYPGTRIGNGVIVHAGAVLGSDGFGYVRDPQSGRYEKFPQIGRLEIEDDVEIGANTTIDRGALETTRIGRGTKIDNLVHIGHNCQVGENVIIAAQAGFSGSITIEDNVVIGGQVGVGEHARIEEGVLLGGQAGVLPKKVLRGKGVAFWGTPAKPLREYLKSLAALARLGRRE